MFVAGYNEIYFAGSCTGKYMVIRRIGKYDGLNRCWFDNFG